MVEVIAALHERHSYVGPIITTMDIRKSHDLVSLVEIGSLDYTLSSKLFNLFEAITYSL
ncbi:hypothetical protein Desaci_4540 [Desulfosporosinus acidiphilus SJ4]|uniref:Uncharacterized protein n=1 Tax=Desulfosporosinus acidiphilus (strain DSM 22704 / JCM 16185 / SJ4) TaxID=646529 RepID=I4DC56_DESAJ|nr:hypothetical protein Desaci_4540 [Desulfosporosinus acidiphilus SJ4]